MASIGATAPTDPSRRRTRWWRAAALTVLATLTLAAVPVTAPADVGDEVRVNVQVAPGSLDATAQLLAAQGGTVAARLDALDTLVVDVPTAQVAALAAGTGVVAATLDGQVAFASPGRGDGRASAPAPAAPAGKTERPAPDARPEKGERPAPDARPGTGKGSQRRDERGGADRGKGRAPARASQGRGLGLDFEGAYTDPAPGVAVDHVARVINADDLWARGITGRGVGIALIDSGVVPIDGLDAGNVRNGPDLSFESQVDGFAHLDTYGHGTHMAGIIAGNDGPPRNDVGGYDLATVSGRHLGIAPDADLLSLKLANYDGATDVSQVLAAIDWVVQHRNDDGLDIRVINLSFGTDGRQDYRLDPLAHAVEIAWRHGIVVVVSAGNDGADPGRLANPAVNPFVIAVGAADTRGTTLVADDSVTDFSNRGDGLRNPDLLAPGRSVLSLRSPGSFIDVNNPQADVPARYLKGSGTSQAAAVVSGAVALLLQERPDLTPDEVKYLLTTSAQRVAGDATAVGAGMLDVGRAARLGVRGSTVDQPHELGTGTGSLEDARGTMFLGEGDTALVGEQTILGDFDASTWARESLARRTWRGGTWMGQEWTDACWCGDSWTGRTWRGRTWRSDTWAGRTWRTDLWEGRTWRDAGWDGRTWRDAGWYGLTWRSEDWNS